MPTGQDTAAIGRTVRMAIDRPVTGTDLATAVRLMDRTIVQVITVPEISRVAIAPRRQHLNPAHQTDRLRVGQQRRRRNHPSPVLRTSQAQVDPTHRASRSLLRIRRPRGRPSPECRVNQAQAVQQRLANQGQLPSRRVRNRPSPERRINQAQAVQQRPANRGRLPSRRPHSQPSPVHRTNPAQDVRQRSRPNPVVRTSRAQASQPHPVKRNPPHRVDRRRLSRLNPIRRLSHVQSSRRRRAKRSRRRRIDLLEVSQPLSRSLHLRVALSPRKSRLRRLNRSREQFALSRLVDTQVRADWAMHSFRSPRCVNADRTRFDGGTFGSC